MRLSGEIFKHSTSHLVSFLEISDCSQGPDEAKSWMFKDAPLHIRGEGVVGLVSQGGAILLELVVALWDVHVPVAV